MRAGETTELLENEVAFVAAERPDVLILACGAIAREVLAVVRLNGWTHVDVRCLPAKLHSTPREDRRRSRREADRARGAATRASSSPTPTAARPARWTLC